jgi:hypothetical protein
MLLLILKIVNAIETRRFCRALRYDHLVCAAPMETRVVAHKCSDAFRAAVARVEASSATCYGFRCTTRPVCCAWATAVVPSALAPTPFSRPAVGGIQTDG